MQALDLDGDGDIDAEEWARGKALIEAQAPGVPNPAVWYATMPGDEAFRITQSGGFGEMTAADSKNERTDYRDEVGGESATRSRPRCPSPFHLSLSLSHTHARAQCQASWSATWGTCRERATRWKARRSVICLARPSVRTGPVRTSPRPPGSRWIRTATPRRRAPRQRVASSHPRRSRSCMARAPSRATAAMVRNQPQRPSNRRPQPRTHADPPALLAVPAARSMIGTSVYSRD